MKGMLRKMGIGMKTPQERSRLMEVLSIPLALYYLFAGYDMLCVLTGVMGLVDYWLWRWRGLDIWEDYSRL